MHAQTVVEILPEAPGGHGLLEIDVGGRHDAHVNGYRFPPPMRVKRNKP